ncbi:MAG: helix-turn-helix domain-containing protein [Moorellaceae bacterium]
MRATLGEKLLLTVPEAAALMGCSRAHLYNLINKGEIPTVRLGRAVRIPRKWLEQWVDRLVGEWAVQNGHGLKTPLKGMGSGVWEEETGVFSNEW